MGCIFSHDDATNSNIERALKRTREKTKKLVRLLLLGAGECGKSTVVKQMKIIHGTGYDEDEKAAFTNVIYANILYCAKCLIEAMKNLGIPYGHKENEAKARIIQEAIAQEDPKVFLKISKQLTSLWEDSGIQNCLQRRNEFQINDSVNYFFDNIRNYEDVNYVPSEQDIIQSRVKTTGIVESEFYCQGLTIQLIDVGGQRSERKKWIHCFDNVQSILFITSLSEYDLVLEEDNQTNRMRESLKLFDSICNNTFFQNTAIIVFFNKKDLFEQKIQKVPFHTYFPEYDGPNDYESVSGYIHELFRSQNRVTSKRIYPHFTTATDSDNLKVVFYSVIDVVAGMNLKEVGLV